MDVSLASLWLPILVSAVAVFFVSSLAWMVLPHHQKDINAITDEKAWSEHLKQHDLPPGTYMWPGCGSSDEMKSAEFKARYSAGPWGSMTILPDKPNFARNLACIFLFYLIVSMFVGYLAAQARLAGAGFMPVFQVAGATAVLAYCAGSIPNAVFFGKPGRFMATDFVDGLVFGLLTGVVFALLWP